MLANEQEVLENMLSADTNLYFVPLVWAASLVNRARKEGRIKDDFSVKTLIDVRYCHNCFVSLTLCFVTTASVTALCLNKVTAASLIITFTYLDQFS